MQKAVLRANQAALKDGIKAKWAAGHQCVMGVMGTGGGKTVTMGRLASELDGVGVVQAHRSELVGQLSLAWAREGIRHDITASSTVRRQIIDLHLDKLGRTFYDPDARWSIESVDTALRRPLKRGVKYVFTDEGHHVLRANKWGRAIAPYIEAGANALLMTATPGRADGAGLGAAHDGIVDALQIGPGLGSMMAEGYLVEYDILQPTASDLDLHDVHVSPSGEFNQKEVAAAVKRSTRIVGDAVEHYTQHAAGRLCIVFAVDIEHATTLLDAYKAQGVAAELVTGKNLDSERLGALKRFEARQTLVLINVDLFGEGTDVPGVEVVQMCRPTASFPLYAQQIGRMLRLDISPELMRMWDTLSIATRRAEIARSRKPRALLIDHVGNTYREYKIGDCVHVGPPELFNEWTLEGRRRGGGGGIPTRTCLSCGVPYERIYDACPMCGAPAPEPDPSARTGPAAVDGSLKWFDPALLAKLRADIARVDGPALIPGGLSDVAAYAVRRNWEARQRGQHALREAMAQWAGFYPGVADDVNYRRFYHTFGIDVLSAMALGGSDAEKLQGKIDADICRLVQGMGHTTRSHCRPTGTR